MTSKTNNKNSKNSQDTKKKFDQYNGGRSLNAIWSCTNIDAHQTIILLWLASRLDFRTDFSGPIRISQNVIAAKTKMSKRTVIRKILKLE